MRKSDIGYDGEHCTWEPCGYGCSSNCPGCWARRSAKRQRKNCPDCADFKIHFHPERLDQPARRKKPATILTCYHGELFDPARSFLDISFVLDAALDSSQHTYVFLTQRPERALDYQAIFASRPNFYLGCTIRDQKDADERLPIFLKIPGNLFISYEPAWREVNWGRWLGGPDAPDDDLGVAQRYCVRCGYEWDDVLTHECPEGFQNGLRGIIIGHDNRKGAPGTDTLDHIYSTVEQARAAGIRVCVKQLWIDGKFYKHPEQFPADLSLRELPWSPK